MTVFPYWSLAVTVTLNGSPAAAEAGAESVNRVAPPAEAVMVREVDPAIGLTVSVAVIVWLPAVVNDTLNDPTPLVRVEFAGSVPIDVEVKWTVPA